MTRPTSYTPSTQAQKAGHAARLAKIQAYGSPREIWVEDGHVFVEGHDGNVMSLTPEVALDLSRRLGEAGAEALIHKVVDEAADQ